MFANSFSEMLISLCARKIQSQCEMLNESGGVLALVVFRLSGFCYASSFGEKP